MGVRKLKHAWWVDFQIDGVRYRKRSPENSRSGAVAYETIVRQRLARGEPIRQSAKEPEPTFEEFSWRWFNTYVKSNNKHSEQLSKKYALSSSLVPFFGHMPVRQIKSYDIERYKAQQLQHGFKNKTIANRLTILNKCLVTAYEWLELEGAPPKIKWLRWAPPEVDYLSPDECKLLLSHAEGTIFEMVLMALRTGMRQGELRALQWSSMDWLTRSVAVRHSRDDHQRLLVPPKNGRTRHIPLDTDVYTLLHARKRGTGYVFLASDGQPFTSDRLHDAMQRLLRQAKFRRIGWHTLRHTFASLLAMRGVPLPAIKELLGHATITTTMRYAHVSPSTLRAAIEMLNPRAAVNADWCQPAVNRWQEMQRNEITEKIEPPKYA
jgi:integrase